MAERSGFSLTSVVLSFLLVAGGIVAALVAAYAIKFEGGQYTLHIIMAVGAAFGGFLAARASRGSTILETAIGGGLVIATLVGLLWATWFGRYLLGAVQRGALIAGGACAVGGAIGAFIGEKMGGEGRSSLPFVLYSALAALGGSFLVYVGVMAFSARSLGAMLRHEGRSNSGQLIVGLAVGCLVTGVACGASARSRPLLATLLGSAAGVFGFFYLVFAMFGYPMEGDALIGAGVFAGGGGIVALLGAFLGWKLAGTRTA